MALNLKLAGRSRVFFYSFLILMSALPFQNFSFSYLDALDFKAGKLICKLEDSAERTCNCHTMDEKEETVFRSVVRGQIKGHKMEKWKGKFSYYGWKGPDGGYINALSFSPEACQWVRSEMLKKERG